MNRPDPLVDAYTIIETPLGPMALGARGDTLRGVILPRPGRASPEKLIGRIWPSAKASPSILRDLVSQVRAYWRGHPDTFRADLDFDGFPAFHRKVWLAVMRIAPGQVRTYGEIAAAVGSPGGARAVGGAMAANPFPLVVPCHRVVAASSLGGFSAPGGVHLKETLLAWERDHGPRAARKRAAERGSTG